MLRKIVNVLVVLPLAIVFIVFAVANRHMVTLSFDPFDSSDAALGVTMPLFVVIIACVTLGVVVGGIVTWFGQRRWRRAARLHEAEARNARSQLADLRGRSQSMGEYGEASGRSSSLPALQDAQYRPMAQDKSGVTL